MPSINWSTEKGKLRHLHITKTDNSDQVWLYHEVSISQSSMKRENLIVCCCQSAMTQVFFFFFFFFFNGTMGNFPMASLLQKVHI